MGLGDDADHDRDLFAVAVVLRFGGRLSLLCKADASANVSSFGSDTQTSGD